MRLAAEGQGLPVQVVRIDDIGRARIAEVEHGRPPLAASVPTQSVDGERGRARLRSARMHIYADALVAGRAAHDRSKPSTRGPGCSSLPVFAIVAFSAVLPLMTVVNYSVQDTFGNNQFFWNGVGWFQELLDPSKELGGRFFDSLWRNLLFSAIILAIEVPLGIASRSRCRAAGWTVALCLVLMALPLLIPWNVVGTIWQVFARGDIGLLGYALNQLGIDYNYVASPLAAWATIVVMDVWHWTSLVASLCYAGLKSHSRRLLPGGPHRRRLALGRLPPHPAAEDAARAPDRGAAALHGLVHDLHRALRAHRRRTRQRHHVPVDRPRQARARASSTSARRPPCRSSTT